MSTLAVVFSEEHMAFVMLRVSRIHPWPSLQVLAESQMGPAEGYREWLIKAITLAGKCELDPAQQSWRARMWVMDFSNSLLGHRLLFLG